MTTQLSLGLASHEVDALDFIAEHPDFWSWFVWYALEVIRAGHSHYGAKAVVERVRWHQAIAGGDDYKLNNNFTATFAREFHRQYPEHDGFFRTRG